MTKTTKGKKKKNGVKGINYPGFEYINNFTVV